MSFTWRLQGTTPTVIGGTDIVHLAGASFNSPIAAGEYNDSTHVKNAGGDNLSASNTPNNNKYISTNQIQINGGSTVALNTLSNANAALRVTFENAEAVALTDIKFYAFDTVTPANAPVNLVVRACEPGDTNWSTPHGSGSALDLADRNTPATSHELYLGLSVSPETAGAKVATLRLELTYS